MARRLGRWLAAAAAAAVCAEGLAMMTPEEYRKARDGAQFHLQLEIRRVTPPEDLARAKFLEAYVNREGAGYAIAAWQLAIVAAPSDRPQFSGKQ